jgi:hypothetical protein
MAKFYQKLADEKRKLANVNRKELQDSSSMGFSLKKNNFYLQVNAPFFKEFYLLLKEMLHEWDTDI